MWASIQNHKQTTLLEKIMRTIAVILKKGGSGKTTTAVNIATVLHQKGKRVLLVDLDPQANATLCTGLDPTSLQYNINDLFKNINIKPADVIIKTSFGLNIIPSHPDLALTEAGMKATQVGILNGLFESIKDDYDYIVIDTPPSDSYLTVSALAYVEEVIIPVQAHFLALQGLTQVMISIDQVRKGLNPKLKILGILPTMVNQRTNISREVIDQLNTHYKDLLFPEMIDYSVKHPESSLAGVPIVIYDPKHPGALSYTKLTESIL